VKKILAALLTAALIALVLWQGRGDFSSQARVALATPDACLERMFRAAGEGDVDAYLDCFAGRERARLERELAGQSRDRFAQSLRGAVAALKGRAVLADGGQGPGATQAVRTVDRVYANRTERQTYHLERVAGCWRITEVRAADAFQPDTPYGTPVFE
jgi:hypothetical protein